MVKLFVVDVKLFRMVPGELIGGVAGKKAGHRAFLTILPDKQQVRVCFLDEMELGDNENVRMQTLDFHNDYEYLVKGIEFRWSEGSRPIGLGTIRW